jgi:O-antigen/teichoic acid export membrane protein
MRNSALDRDQVLMAAFVAVESAHAYSAFLPSIFTIRHFGHEAGVVKDIRDGELIGTGFALVLGGIVSALTENALPFIFAGVTAAAMVGIYEYALRTRNGAVRAAIAAPQRGAPVIDTAFDVVEYA